MPEKTDRRIDSSNRVLLVLIIVLAAFAVSGLYLWSRMEVPAPTPSDGAESPPSLAPLLSPAEPLPVMMFFPSGGVMASESVSVERQYDSQSQAREAVAALLTSPRSWQAPLLKNLRLSALYLDTAGTAYVDLVPASKDRDFRGSVRDELLAVYAIVNTLTQNFEEVKQVHLLIEGREAETLAGHIDLSEFFRARPDLARQ